MLVRKGFRFRLYPSEQQVVRMAAWEDALRFLWNLALEQRRMALARPRDERPFVTAFDQINQLTELRAALPWLAVVPRNVCAQLLVELDKGWQRCFKRLARAPRWKRKGRNQLGLTEPHPNVWRLDGNILHFPKLGNLHVVAHRLLEGKPKSCTIRRDGDQWFASIMCEVELPEPALRTEPVVAIDRGVVNLIADSDGRIVPSPRYLERSLVRLARAQRVVARRQKGSKNREKAKLRVMRLHRTVRRQREHLLHVESARYAKSHGVVIVEKLNVQGMVKSNVARGILDAGWSRFETMLDYKLAWSGGSLEHEVAAFSSQTCSACGCVDARSRVSQAVFHCTGCGHREHADVNAAKVLKQRRANRSVKPAEATGSKSGLRSRKRKLRPMKGTADYGPSSGCG